MAGHFFDTSFTMCSDPWRPTVSRTIVRIPSFNDQQFTFLGPAPARMPFYAAQGREIFVQPTDHQREFGSAPDQHFSATGPTAIDVSRILSAQFGRAKSRIVDVLGLRAEDLGVLEVIGDGVPDTLDETGMRPAEIADALGRSERAIGHTTQRLCEAGLCILTPASTAGVLSLTGSGTAVCVWLHVSYYDAAHALANAYHSPDAADEVAVQQSCWQTLTTQLHILEYQSFTTGLFTAGLTSTDPPTAR